MRGRGYSAGVVQRARALRDEGRSLRQTAEALRGEFDEASEITKDTLASLLRRSQPNPAGRTAEAGLDARTVSYIHTIVHRAFRDAVRWGRLARNPADAADPPRVPHKSGRVHAWDGGTLRSFLDAALRRAGPALSAVGIAGPLRHCGGERRSVFGGPTLILRPDAVSTTFLRRVARHSLPRLTLYGLRHTWATLALEQGIHPRVVQERLGHSTIAITLGIYSHVSQTLDDEAAEIVAAVVLSSAGPAHA